MSDHNYVVGRVVFGSVSDSLYREALKQRDNETARASESVAEVARLRAENARLREALEEVRDWHPMFNGGVKRDTAEDLVGYIKYLQGVAYNALVKP
jgi:hypothetical protein